MSRPGFRSAVFCLAGLLWLASPARPQQAPPSRDPNARASQTPGPTGTASIAGTVTVAVTGQPARKARINLAGGDLRGVRTATADEQGRFAFTALPAGRYTVSASKPGHVTISYGQRQPGPGRPGTAIQLADGQQFDMKLQLPRGGVLTGTVLDEHAEPTPGTQVRVMRYVMQAGGRTLQSAGSGATDDRGIFRVYGLQPGEYVVCATPRNANAEISRLQAELETLRERTEAVSRTDAAQAQQLAQTMASVQGRIAEHVEEQTGYAPVCYPGTTTPSMATPLVLGVGEERSGVDFQLQLMSLGSVTGTILLPSGARPQNFQVMLVDRAAAVSTLGTMNTRVGTDGQFRFSNVPPGQYALVARGTVQPARPVAVEAGQPGPRPSGVRMWGTADVSVDGRAVSNVMLSLHPGMTVSGQLSFEGTQPAPADLSRVRVALSPADLGATRELTSGASGTVDASGRFTIQHVMPGRYRLNASAAGGWFTASSVVAGQDSLDFPFDVKPNQNIGGAAITMSNQPTEVRGTLVDDRGQPATDYTLIVFPADRRFWTPGGRRVSTTRPATDGGFVLRNLAPGDYRIATVIDPEPGAWSDPAYLEQLEPASMGVTLAPGEKTVQNVRVR
jgi:protocatechuate 3,4-dioxygenase beta subunit